MRGGRRPGAGRKKGSDIQKTAAKALEVATAGVQPIEVVITVMRNAWDAQDFKTAAEMAEVALPYTTPRLAATTVTHQGGLDGFGLDELRIMLAAARNIAAAGREGAGSEDREDAARESYH